VNHQRHHHSRVTMRESVVPTTSSICASVLSTGPARAANDVSVPATCSSALIVCLFVCLFVYLLKETFNKTATMFSRTGARKA